MKDILGKALLDYFQGNHTEDIITETNISEEDEMPLSYLFRDFKEMPALEQQALRLSKGSTLDVGCGAGNHSLYLQNQGLDVLAIDISEGAIEVAKQRGVERTKHIELLNLNDETFDTILLIMNGTGIFSQLSNVSKYLQHLRTLLNDGGQILIDTSDIKYMFDEGEDGGIWVPSDRYYGELTFTMSYKKEKGEPFDWLYLDANLFETAATSNGFDFEIIAHGEHFDYLARLTIAANSPLQ
ncbi:SAM-dependent methyltransferase [Patiriisocius marinistellae]|uniref:SAM-dependent methyltransferase n=1 Tax=Patiriisocius marinistellae TaxID=2494560 RepID=A0A5J4G490_9FLAO|nr:class I SAM-dependent methyltransferase [Patiriisocius marinistellae]GEQ87331.1 SAM-dependent methyltransferase [Patiriisocius marinistellae]